MRIVPATTTEFGRRLFPDSNVWARFTISTLPLLPQFQFELSSSRRFDRTQEDTGDAPHIDIRDEMRPPSRTGLDSGIVFWTAGITLNGLLPGLIGQLGLHFEESGIRVKTGLNLGLMARKVTIGASWHDNSPTSNNSVGVDAGLGTDGVVLSLE